MLYLFTSLFRQGLMEGVDEAALAAKTQVD